MAKEIKTHIRINASPENVWAVLTDFSAYPEWNPFVKSLTGEVAVGKRIKIVLPGMTFTPKVLAINPNQEFRWLGNLFFPGLFDGEHRFLLVDNGDGSTTLHHTEKFGGILVGLFSKMLDTETIQHFEAMNRALKARVEAI